MLKKHGEGDRKRQTSSTGIARTVWATCRQEKPSVGAWNVTPVAPQERRLRNLASWKRRRRASQTAAVASQSEVQESTAVVPKQEQLEDDESVEDASFPSPL